jgi:hypothetical protein
MIKTVDFTVEEMLIHHLIVKTAGLKDVTLLNGKLGIAIAFFEYGSFVKNSVYTDFADDLIDGFLSTIHDRMSFVFSSGLTGIGWGIEYLIQKGFVVADSNQICGDLDTLIMRTDACRIKDMSLTSGLEGILHYIFMRIQGACRQNNTIPFDTAYLSDVHKALQAVSTEECTERFYRLINKFHIYMNNGVYDYDHDLLSLIEVRDVDEKDVLVAKLGLNGGLAGKLLDMAINRKK